MLYDLFCCSKCDFEQKYPEDITVATNYLYRLSSGFSFGADSALGWCDSCKKLCNIETLDLDNIQKYKNRLILCDETIVQEKSKSFLKTLKQRYKLRQEIKGLNKLLELIPLREHPKCLKCGSAIVSKINRDAKFLHRQCGGEISCKRVEDGCHWDFDPKIVLRYYSVNGEFLYEERN